MTAVVLVAGDPVNLEQPDECPVCRFDALLTFPIYALLPGGVSRAGRVARCLRCHTEARRVGLERPQPPV